MIPKDNNIVWNKKASTQ